MRDSPDYLEWVPTLPSVAPTREHPREEATPCSAQEQTSSAPSDNQSSVPLLPSVMAMGEAAYEETKLPYTQVQARSDSSEAQSSPHPADPIVQLEQLQDQLSKVESEISTVKQELKAQSIPPRQARDALAQLEAQLDRLQCKGIDSVSTAGLPATAEETARTFRKELTRKAQRLQSYLDDLFEAITAMSTK